MNTLTHIIAGCIFGFILFFNREIYLYDIILFIFLSIYMDLDHIYSWLKKKPKKHLRTFIQEPFGILIIGLPTGIILFYMFNEIIYFWLSLILYIVHISLDYMCIFEAYPLDPFNKKIIKKEGYGFVLPFDTVWRKSKKKFPHTISEKYIMIALMVILIIIAIFYYY